jgi:hypothetical protein
LYRKLHRPEDAQRALATFQKLKDESAERQQHRVEENRKSEKQDNATPADSSPSAPSPQDSQPPN